MGQLLKHPGKTKPLTPAEQAERDKKAREEQAKFPLWKRYAIDTLEGLWNGLTSDPTEDSKINDARLAAYPTGAGKVAQFLGEISQAGLPGPTLMKKLGLNRIFHGSKNLPAVVSKGFDPAVYNKGDTLGWMTHFAEDPRYSSGFIGSYDSDARLPIPEALKGRGLIPAELTAKYAMDAFNPDLEDITRIAANFNPKGAYSPSNSKREAAKKLLEAKKHFHNSSDSYELEKTVRQFLESMGQTGIKSAGIDAIRYSDVGEKAWALAHPTAAKNAITGEPLGVIPSIIPDYLRQEFILPDNAGILVKNKSKLTHPKVKEVKPENSPHYSTMGELEKGTATNINYSDADVSAMMKEAKKYDLWVESYPNYDALAKALTEKTGKNWVKSPKIMADYAAEAPDYTKTHFELFDPKTGETVAWVKSLPEVDKYIKSNPKLDYNYPKHLDPNASPGFYGFGVSKPVELPKPKWSYKDDDKSFVQILLPNGKVHDELSWADIGELYPHSLNSVDAINKYIADTEKATGAKLTWISKPNIDNIPHNLDEGYSPSAWKEKKKPSIIPESYDF